MAYTPIFADETDVQDLTSELDTPDSGDHYDKIILIAYKDSDLKIKSRLQKANLTVPTTGDSGELDQIGTLYAAAFLFTYFYSNEEDGSPAAEAYNKEADRRLDEYVDYQLGLDSGRDESLTPGAATSISFD